MIHSFMAIIRLLFLLAFIASWFLLFILLFRAVPSTDARPLPPDATNLDGDAAEAASVPERCSTNAQDRHSYYWTVQHPDQPNVVHHLYGFLALKGQVQWDNLSLVQKTHFEAANVSVFETDATGYAELHECVRNASEREMPLGSTLAERLDAYFDPSTGHHLLPLVGREWRNLTAGWLLLGLLQVQVNKEIASLSAEGRASRGEAWHGSLLQQAERMHKRIEFVERMPERCNALPSVNKSELAIGIEHLMDELEALEYASADARAAPVKRIIDLYKCGQYGPADAMIGMQFLSSVSAERKDNLTMLNKLLLHDLMSGRNRRWMERIGPMLKNNTQGLSYFFAMNSLHFLVAKDSLVDLLRSRGFRVRELHPDELLGNYYTTAEKLPDNIDSIQQLPGDTEETPYHTDNTQKLPSDAEEQLPDNTAETLTEGTDYSTEKLPGNSYSTHMLPSNTVKLPDNQSSPEKLREWPNDTTEEAMTAATVEFDDDDRKGMLSPLVWLGLLLCLLAIVVCVLDQWYRCRRDANECDSRKEDSRDNECAPKGEARNLPNDNNVQPPPPANGRQQVVVAKTPPLANIDEGGMEDISLQSQHNTSSGSLDTADGEQPRQQQPERVPPPPPLADPLQHNLVLGNRPATAENQPRPQPERVPTPPPLVLSRNLLLGNRPATAAEGQPRAQPEELPLVPMQHNIASARSCSATAEHHPRPQPEEPTPAWVGPVAQMAPAVQLQHNLFAGSCPATEQDQPLPQTEESCSATRAQTQELTLAHPHYLFSGSCSAIDANPIRAQTVGDWLSGSSTIAAEGQLRPQTEEPPLDDPVPIPHNLSIGSCPATTEGKRTEEGRPATEESATHPQTEEGRPETEEESPIRPETEGMHADVNEPRPDAEKDAEDMTRTTDVPLVTNIDMRDKQYNNRVAGPSSKIPTKTDSPKPALAPSDASSSSKMAILDVDVRRKLDQEVHNTTAEEQPAPQPEGLKHAADENNKTRSTDAEKDGEDAQRETQREDGEDAQRETQREDGEDAQTRAEEPMEPEMDMRDKQYNNQQEEADKVAKQPSMIPTAGGKTRQAPKPAPASMSVSAYQFPSSSKTADLRLEFYRNQQAQLQQHNNRHQLDKVDERKAEEEEERAEDVVGEVAQPKVAEDTNVAQPGTEEMPKEEDGKAE